MPSDIWRSLPLHSRPGCGIVVLVPEQHNLSMRASASIARTLIKATRLLATALLMLLWAASADAAATRGNKHQPGAVCNARLTLRTVLRHPRSVGPLARRHARTHSVLPPTTTLFQRGSPDRLDADGDAIPNDAPAARIDDNQSSRSAGLGPIGILVSSAHRLPSSSDYFPRSPRGPPHQI
jgi:hypothetical protein